MLNPLTTYTSASLGSCVLGACVCYAMLCCAAQVPYWGAWTAMLANLDAVGKHYSTSGIDPTRQKTA